MKKNIYITTRKLVELSEISLSRAKYIYSTKKGKLFSWEFDVRLPMGYMLIGGKDFFLPYIKAIILFLIILFFVITFDFFISEINLEVQFQILISFLIIIIFALPSRYAYYSSNEESISKVVKILYHLKIKSKDELELIEENIKSIDIRVQDRIKALQWLISVCWIVYIFITEQIVSLFDISKIEEKHVASNLLNYFGDNILIIMYFLIPIIFISVYKRGMNFLFKSILFALNDYKIHIQDKTNKPLQTTFLKLTKNK